MSAGADRRLGAGSFVARHARLVLTTFFVYFMLGLPYFAALRTNVLLLAAFANRNLVAGDTAGDGAVQRVHPGLHTVCANLFAGARQLRA